MIDKNFSDERREYQQDSLSSADLPANPWLLFDRWLQQVLAAKLQDPTAMILASVDAQGQPFQRTVLLKKVSDQGLVFFTNLKSRKAQQIEHNAQVSLLFPWLSLEKQVAVCGTARLLGRDAVEAYFHSRPTESQLAAWASKQSQPLGSRAELESNFERCRAKMAAEGLQTPDFWGGFVIEPSSFEFWQGRSSRLHDRFLYERVQEAWSVQRLSP